MPQTYKGLTIPSDTDTADGPKAFADYTDSLEVLFDTLIPVGTIWLYGASSSPTGWLTCQGQSLATTGTYADLFAVLGYSYGGGGAAFLLPNLIGRVPVGHGGSYGINTKGGSETVTIGIGNMPSHNHGNTGNDGPLHAHAGWNGNEQYLMVIPGSGPWTAPGGSGLNLAARATTHSPDQYHQHATGNAGGGAPIENRQPFIGMNFIIKY